MVARNLTQRKTGLALSALTSVVLLLGYAVVQLLEGDWQPTKLEVPPSRSGADVQPNLPPPIVLRPRVPDDAASIGWELPPDDSLNTATREREIR